MLASTPTKDYVAIRNPTAMSPSYRTRYCTPPRLRKDSAKYDSPLLPPSPLRQRPLFPSHFSATPSDSLDADDFFAQSPYKPSAPAQVYAPYPNKPQPIAADDDDGSIFLSSSSTSPTIPVSLSQPLRTPVRQCHEFGDRPALFEKQLNAPPNVRPPATDATRVGVGTKRKQGSQNMTTPLRPHTLAPLKVAGSKTVDPRATTCFMFDKLAPLEAPKFIARTPQTKAETEAYLRRQTATLTKLKLADLDNSDDDFSLDPVPRLGPDIHSFISTSTGKGNSYKSPASRGKGEREVAEAVSPGGHVIKRRAKSRPVSTELLESVLHPSPSPTKRAAASAKFPTSRSHARSSSGSSAEATSPRLRKRVGGASHPYAIRSIASPPPPRVPMNRISSGSSASLFFGPSIPSSDLPSRNRTTSSTAPAPSLPASRSQINHRHSYSTFGDDIKAWNTIQTRADSPSPESSPARASLNSAPHRPSFDDDDAVFGDIPPDSSFQLCVTKGTPSPHTRRLDLGTLQRKYRPRDSGVVISDDEEGPSLNSSSNSNSLNGVPRTSTSVGSINSDVDDGLVTPGVAPELGSGWPGSSIFIHGTDDAAGLRQDSELDVEAFIIRTLTTASKGNSDGIKRAPGTPVKKVKTSFLGIDRPWQSAVAPKVGLRYDVDRRSKPPRKSLPAVLPHRHHRGQSTDSEGDDDSPVANRRKYAGLGLGRPQPPLYQEGIDVRTRLLMRRSSSGAFSSGSDSVSLIGTPTRAKGDGFVPLSTAVLKTSPTRTASGSSTTSSVMTSPTRRSRPVQLCHSRQTAPRSSSLARRQIVPSEEEQPGRFSRDFEEIDELGSGEFGKVIKVLSKDQTLYAIKKSKQFEGPKHRLRLREEVDILKHLSRYAHSIGLQDRHPNVLAYIDSWEEDETLCIQTELCESGNLGRFLWEYGRAFPRLDEARVWKIIVDLSNGLRFIHEAAVIHLDLKPSNIFLTKDGRFKIGDFGMASLWPRKRTNAATTDSDGFEREGDKLYLAPEVLQGRYGKAADVFSLGMTILETASNIVVPDQGEAWHRLRQEDFSQVDLDDSPELLGLIKQLMRTDPAKRASAQDVFDHPIVSRARAIMEQTYDKAVKTGATIFAASPLASVSDSFLVEILCRPLGVPMDTGP